MAELSVLHVSQPVSAGVARVVTDLVAGQVGRGQRVTVACPEGGGLSADAAAAGARVVRWAATRQPGPTLFGEILALRRVLRDVRPDVVHLHSSKAGLVGRLVLRGRVPTVFAPHAWSFSAVDGSMAKAALRWERFGARWAHRVLCVSEGERTEAADAGVRAAVDVVANGVRTEEFTARLLPDRAAARERLGVPRDAALAVCVGRLCQQKGQDVLLAAWDEVVRAVPEARLALVGEGPDEAEVRRLVGKLPRPDSVLLPGAVRDPRVWYAAADLVVSASRWEGMALVPLEAMAAGRAVLLTGAAGARECLPPEHRADAVVAAGDVRGLAAALLRDVADRDGCAVRGAEARAHVAGRHDVARVVSRTDEVYCQAWRRWEEHQHTRSMKK